MGHYYQESQPRGEEHNGRGLGNHGDRNVIELVNRRIVLNPGKQHETGEPGIEGILNQAGLDEGVLLRQGEGLNHRATLSHPALDPIRPDPRFSDLAARVGRAMGLDPANVSRFVSAHLVMRHSPGR